MDVIGDDQTIHFVKTNYLIKNIYNLCINLKWISLFGQGEICYRDFEIFEFGVGMIKPSMERIDTNPNPYIENETYIFVDLDWGNLNETVKKMFDNYDKLLYIIDNSRKVYDELYSAHNFCKYWYDFF